MTAAGGRLAATRGQGDRGAERGRRAEVRHITLYDTTLRDGTQGAGLSLSVEDKLQIAALLDDIGVEYIEGGWPMSNPKDTAFFREARGRFKRAKLAAFGSTARPGHAVEDDANLLAILDAGAPVATIFGKSSVFQARDILGIDPEDNLRLVEASVRFLVQQGLEVVFDAEHYFDGLAADPDYTLAVLRAAENGGAAWIVLCDTNGGSLPSAVAQGIAAARRVVATPLGIHAHNDAGLAVANSLAAVEAGADMIQGTVNGYGERCGNANWVTLWPTVSLKLGLDMGATGVAALSRLTALSRTVAEIANLAPDPYAPYVGENAFTHKAGVHVSAVRKFPSAYEHISPEAVGNSRRVLISELAGRSNLLAKFQELQERDGDTASLIAKIKAREQEGYQFEGAEASVALMVRRQLGTQPVYYRPQYYHVWVTGLDAPRVEAVVRLKVGDATVLEIAEGTGPVHGLDQALRKALRRYYPALEALRLTDYKVRVLDGRAATAAAVRVLVTSQWKDTTFHTIGVSPDILEASWLALVDAIDYALSISGTQPVAGSAAEAAG